jgi:hypothetical protein
MRETDWLEGTSPAFRLILATSWLAPDWWQENQARAIRDAVAAGPDWAEYLHLVDRHQITALSWASLCRVPGVAIPESIQQKLHELSHACRIRAMQHCLLLNGVLKAFNRESIPSMPLKGPVLSFTLYGDVGLRQSSDLDVEVAREDLTRAQACLESLCWQPDSTLRALSPRQWESFMRNGHHINFVHAHSCRRLELHWRNYWETPVATRARWDRSVPFVWQRRSVRVMSRGDLALYLCRQGGRDAWSFAKGLGDLARAHCLHGLDWDAAFDEARKSDQKNVLLAGLCLLNRVYGLCRPELPAAGWQTRPSKLIKIPLRLLKDSEGLPVATGMISLRSTLRMSRYERLLCPRTTLKDSLAALLYCQEDFVELPLPDVLFWAYKPLRLSLWAWRWIRQARRESPNHDTIQDIQTRACDSASRALTRAEFQP